ncbi:hypothetical protein [Terracoccus sp. 273MFTsu3.1]|uniref:hypothetical protein n=1 Tax=Terracoccus sp. 273MFTsu3.1 TaxID=1172188 RepID=UPI000373D873|nr:hypothetical protein [Terracoccus sp. 273MFTsu3.1]
MTERPYDTATPVEGAGRSTYGTGADFGAAEAAANQGATDSTTAVIGDEAKSVASDAAQSGRQVAETAATGVKDVTSEVSTQLRQLFDQVRSELDAQASTQGKRAASGLRSIADELKQMASSSETQGIAGEVAHQASDRARSAADWLSDRQPGELVDELRSFARRRPGTFLLGAAVLGVIGGRVTRGLTADSGPSDAAQPRPVSTSSNDRSSSGVAAMMPTTPVSTPSDDAPYAVGVRDSETHAVTAPFGSSPAVPADLGAEGHGGVR